MNKSLKSPYNSLSNLIRSITKNTYIGPNKKKQRQLLKMEKQKMMLTDQLRGTNGKTGAIKLDPSKIQYKDRGLDKYFLVYGRDYTGDQDLNEDLSNDLGDQLSAVQSMTSSKRRAPSSSPPDARAKANPESLDAKSLAEASVLTGDTGKKNIAGLLKQVHSSKKGEGQQGKRPKKLR